SEVFDQLAEPVLVFVLVRGLVENSGVTTLSNELLRDYIVILQLAEQFLLQSPGEETTKFRESLLNLERGIATLLQDSDAELAALRRLADVFRLNFDPDLPLEELKVRWLNLTSIASKIDSSGGHSAAMESYQRIIDEWREVSKVRGAGELRGLHSLYMQAHHLLGRIHADLGDFSTAFEIFGGTDELNGSQPSVMAQMTCATMSACSGDRVRMKSYLADAERVVAAAANQEALGYLKVDYEGRLAQLRSHLDENSAALVIADNLSQQYQALGVRFDSYTSSYSLLSANCATELLLKSSAEDSLSVAREALQRTPRLVTALLLDMFEARYALVFGQIGRAAELAEPLLQRARYAYRGIATLNIQTLYAVLGETYLWTGKPRDEILAFFDESVAPAFY
ncbi:MAG TPA: hypothetical protein VJB16_00865, partial [archaeon]|nr:hypothetical protein [archaeon]